VLLERSAELGDVDASYQLGELYSGGEKILRDDAKAFAYYMKAAQGGCGLAMGNVGVYFTNGRGKERDYVKGLAWLIVARHFGVDLGQEKRLRPFLLQHDPADVAKAEKMSDGLIREIEARVR
jgi:TPR repeat protein